MVVGSHLPPRGFANPRGAERSQLEAKGRDFPETLGYTIASIREPNEEAWRMLLKKYLCMLQMQSSNIISESPHR